MNIKTFVNCDINPLESSKAGEFKPYKSHSGKKKIKIKNHFLKKKEKNAPFLGSRGKPQETPKGA